MVEKTRATHRASEDAVFRKVADEAVLLNLKTGTYFGLNEVGTRIWDLYVVEQAAREDVLGKLREEYEVGPEELASDFDALVRQLLKKGLIRPNA